MSENVSKPTMYPCASGVKMPQVGADETSFKPFKADFKVHSLLPSKKPPHALNKYYIKKISSNFSFSDDVIRERCFHTLPYDRKYLAEAFDVSGLIRRPLPSRRLIGRHNASGPDLRHMPCHINSKLRGKLKPISCRVDRSDADLGRAVRESESENEVKDRSSWQKANVFLTEGEPEELRPSSSRPETLGGQEDNGWDECLLSIMSKTTAEWIVKQRVPSSDYKEKLEKFLEGRYGTLMEGEPELIKDTISEVEFETQDESSKSTWKKAHVNMLDNVRKLTAARGLQTDPYCDDNSAAFYRLPAGFRKAKKYHDKEEAAAINKTAHKIDVVTYKPPPPLTLRDYINPKIGDKIYDTDNKFVQEWLTGGRQVYQRDQRLIVMDSNNKYKKCLEDECPQSADLWYHHDNEINKNKPDAETYQRGLKRWKALPQPIDDGTQKITDQPQGGDTSLSKSSECDKKSLKATNVLLRIVDDWRAKWQLDMRYTDATPEDLIRDMADIHPHIRLKAITTCARAAEYLPPPGLGIQLNSEATKMDHVRLLPENLFLALELCLNDKNLRVKRAAAVSLYTLDRPTTKAESILREALYDEKATDRWTAAQCLAYFGECDSDVVSELISQLMMTEDMVKHEQAGALLSRLSQNSTLVHSMIGEQLNSSSWRHRVMACHMLPKLEGHINKDLVNKLTHLMWSDWHREVRKVAAQTLGKTGHGKHVHDELRSQILGGSERMRVEAIKKVGHLGIMTAKLLVAFLRCFEDQYVSVRMEVCRACSNLEIKDQQVLDKLVDLATFDPVWKVKALAIQALGSVGVVTKEIRQCILWAFRYEGQAGVRAEACNTIRKLELRETEVGHMLQDRYLVETSDIVKEEIIQALGMFDISPVQDLDMVAQIKNKVRELCTRNNICAQITINEKENLHQDNVDRLIYQPPDSPQRSKQTPRYAHAARRLIQTPSGQDPGHRDSESSSRPFSQETTDKEIRALFDRYADNDSTPATNLDVTLTGSRQETGNTQRSPISRTTTTTAAEDDRSYDDDENSDLDQTSRPKSYVTFASPEMDLVKVDEGAEQGVRPARSLGEAQTYVEITGNPEEPGHFSEHVVTVAHDSSQGSSLMTSPGYLDLSSDSGNMPDHSDEGLSVTSSLLDPMERPLPPPESQPLEGSTRAGPPSQSSPENGDKARSDDVIDDGDDAEERHDKNTKPEIEQPGSVCNTDESKPQLNPETVLDPDNGAPEEVQPQS